jgi:hypothetical protein
MVSRSLTRSIAISAAAIAVVAGTYGIVRATSGSSSAIASTPTSSSAAKASTTKAVKAASPNARSGPAAGGASGKVGIVSTSSFTLATSAGQKVTVDKASSTKYQKGMSAVSASAITKGAGVLVLGTTNGTTIKATQVIVQPTGSSGSATSSAAKVIPFKRGAPTTSKKVGQIPASYSQGAGTVVSGTAANKATEAALAAYPGGVVNRVVKLSDGDYNIHYIGVDWPHHIFANPGFKIIGAE